MSLELARQPLRVAVRDELIERLYRGDILPGQQLNESHLADDLGVSRTPLREALLELTFMGFLASAKNRGFYVRDLTTSEGGELYRLCGHLEAMALRATPTVSPDQLARLQELDERRLAVTDDPPESVRLDNEWHDILIEGAENDVLLEVLRFVKGRLYRYEYAYSAAVDRVQSAIGDHAEIIGALSEGRRDDACELLEAHWTQGAEVIEEMAEKVDAITQT